MSLVPLKEQHKLKTASGVYNKISEAILPVADSSTINEDTNEQVGRSTPTLAKGDPLFDSCWSDKFESVMSLQASFTSVRSMFQHHHHSTSSLSMDSFHSSQHDSLGTMFASDDEDEREFSSAKVAHLRHTINDACCALTTLDLEAEPTAGAGHVVSVPKRLQEAKNDTKRIHRSTTTTRRLLSDGDLLPDHDRSLATLPPAGSRSRPRVLRTSSVDESLLTGSSRPASLKNHQQLSLNNKRQSMPRRSSLHSGVSANNRSSSLLDHNDSDDNPTTPIMVGLGLRRTKGLCPQQATKRRPSSSGGSILQRRAQTVCR